MVSAELRQLFKVKSFGLWVAPELAAFGKGKRRHFRSQVTFGLSRQDDEEATHSFKPSFPTRRMARVFPTLASDYELQRSDEPDRVYLSRQRWSLGKKQQAVASHEEKCLKLVNFGAQIVEEDHFVRFVWRTHSDLPVIPSGSAGLLLSFALASLARYRPSLQEQVGGSKVSLLFEIFMSESSGFLIPMFRNLLYGETTYIGRTPYT